MDTAPMTQTHVDVNVALVSRGINMNLNVPRPGEQTGEKTREPLSDGWSHVGLGT